MVGRDAELAALRELIGAACARQGAVGVVEGPAGIGKTRLLEAIAAEAATHGLAVHVGRGSELERDIPFGLVRQLFEPTLGAAPARQREQLLSGAAAFAAAVFPGVVDTAQAPRRDASYLALHGLYWLVANLAARAPLLLVADDAHWADAPSLRFLAYLANRCADLAVVVVVAARPAEPGAELQLLDEIASRPHCRIVRPAPLDSVAVGELLRASFGTPVEEPFTAACLQATGGNPFFLREVIGALATHSVRPVAADAHRALEASPPTIARSVARRLGQLPAGALALARAAAIAGDGEDPALVAELAGLTRTDAVEAADRLARADIMRGGDLGFVHPVVRSVVHDAIPTLEREAMHGRAAVLLEARDVDPDRVAQHLLASAPRGEARPVAVLRRAAHSALARGAPDVATTYLRRALAEPPADPERIDVLVELGTAETTAYDTAGFHHLRQALALADDPARRADLALLLGGILFTQAYFSEAAHVFESVRSELPAEQAPLAAELESQLLVVALTDLSVLSRVGGLEPIAARLDEDGLAADPMGLVAVAWAAAATVCPASRGADLADRALQALRPAGRSSAEQDALVMACGGAALMVAGRLQRARELWDASAADARARGSLSQLALAIAMRAPVMLRLGEVARAEADVQELAERAGELGASTLERRVGLAWVLAPLLDTLVERGQLDAAEAAVQATGLGDELPELLQMNYLLDSLGRLRIAQGRHEEGMAFLRECGRRLAAWGASNPGFAAWRSHLAPVLAQVTDPEEALALASEELALARRFGVDREAGMALRATGLVLGGDDQVELLREAVAVLERAGARGEQARALTDLGATLRRRGHLADAREPLRRAIDLAQRLGATATAGRAHTELVATGARPRKLVLSGVDSLTASERRVAEMAAGGMPNRAVAQALFVTEKTVEGHLRQAFRKLDIASRTQLREALSAGGGVAD